MERLLVARAGRSPGSCRRSRLPYYILHARHCKMGPGERVHAKVGRPPSLTLPRENDHACKRARGREAEFPKEGRIGYNDLVGSCSMEVECIHG